MKDFDNLENFLEHVALATSVDQDWDGEKVNMMTMHADLKDLSLMWYFYLVGKKVLFPHQKSIEEKGQNGLEEESDVWHMQGLPGQRKKLLISFAMNRFYQGDWIDSMASRFIEELPEKFLEKNSFFDDDSNR